MYAVRIAALFALAAAFPVTARAADHTDGPQASADPTADITDLYTWMSQDGSKVYLVMDVYKNATVNTKFSNVLRYTFHTTSGARYAAFGAHPVDIICTFDMAQKISCWVGNADYVTGDASNPQGITSQSGKTRVFAGLRNDPFFFNSAGFQQVAALVHQVAGQLQFDAAGCPKLDQNTSMVLVNTLKSDGMMGPGKDNFSRLNVLSIVVAVDKTLLTQDGPALSVWAATHKP